MKRKKISLCLAGIILCASALGGADRAYATESNDEKILAEIEKREENVIDEEYLENENEAVLNNEMITEYVDEYKEETGEYPEYYAGTYVNDDGNLVVCVTDDSSEITENMMDVADNEDIIIQEVETNINDIMDLYDSIGDIYEEAYEEYVDNEEINAVTDEDEEYAEMLDSMTGYYVDEENNNIVIELKDLDTQKEEAFKELFSDDSCIVFEEGEQVTETTGWRPGRKIYTPSSSMSTGYRAYLS